MRIEEDVKLDYKDVLIRPKRSTLASRREGRDAAGTIAANGARRGVF